MAARYGQMVNVEEILRDADNSQTQAKDWLEILENYMVQKWGKPTWTAIKNHICAITMTRRLLLFWKMIGVLNSIEIKKTSNMGFVVIDRDNYIVPIWMIYGVIKSVLIKNVKNGIM